MYHAIEASYQPDEKSLFVQLTLPSVPCTKLITEIWIRIYDIYTSELHSHPYVKIPTECLISKDNNVSVTLRSRKTPCLCCIPDLVPCRTYRVKILPNYQSLKGDEFVTTVPVLPKVDNYLRKVATYHSSNSF